MLVIIDAVGSEFSFNNMPNVLYFASAIDNLKKLNILLTRIDALQTISF